MFVTRKHLSEGRFCEAAGATMACRSSIPWFRPDGTDEDCSSARPALGFVYLPHGAIMDRWTPRPKGPASNSPDPPTAEKHPRSPERDQRAPPSGSR
jgi:hypothetical protein